MFLFGYTTLIGWAYYGEQFFEYILGREVTMPYRWIYCLLIPFGAVAKVDARLGVGRSDERAAGVPEPDRPRRLERHRRRRSRARAELLSSRTCRAPGRRSSPGLEPSSSPVTFRLLIAIRSRLLRSLPQFPRPPAGSVWRDQPSPSCPERQGSLAAGGAVAADRLAAADGRATPIPSSRRRGGCRRSPRVIRAVPSGD